MRPELRIDLAVFRANVAAVRTRIAPSTLMIVVKDDAYGHGIAEVVPAALSAGLDWFGSYDVHTALEVRRITDAARVFAWATSTDAEIDEALLHDIDLGIGTAEYLERTIARARALGIGARVHLKIDTGLHRNGVLPENWAAAIATARAAEAEGVLDLVGVWSHIAEASDAEDDEARAVFVEAIRVAGESGPTPALQHLTASAASWWRPEMRGSLSRIGAFCYGVRSADGPELEGILPIAELVARVIGIEGDDAVIGIGAFDGLPSTLAGATVGSPDGARTLRRIDPTTSVVAGWPGMSVGDEVRVFGAGSRGDSTATTLAERLDTVGEEIITRLSPRVRRHIVD